MAKNAIVDEARNCDCAVFWLGAQAGMPVLLKGKEREDGGDKQLCWCCVLFGGTGVIFHGRLPAGPVLLKGKDSFDNDTSLQDETSVYRRWLGLGCEENGAKRAMEVFYRGATYSGEMS